MLTPYSPKNSSNTPPRTGATVVPNVATPGGKLSIEISVQQRTELLNKAIALQNSHRYLEACLCYEYFLQLQPENWVAQYNYGLVVQHLRRYEDAIRAYQKAASLNPALAEAHNNLGNVLQQLERFSDAAASYEQALTINPQLAQAQFNLGSTYQKLSRWTDSIAPLKQAVALDSNNTGAWSDVFRALHALKRTQEAVKWYEQWESKGPDSPSRLVAGFFMSRYLGGVEREQQLLQKLSAPDDFWNAASGNYLLSSGTISELLGLIQYFDISQTQLLSLYRRYADAANKLGHAQKFQLPRRTHGEKIRIGYVSADFRVHVMGKIMREIISRHDTSQFEIYLFALQESIHDDDLTTQFMTIAHRYHNIFKLETPAAAKLIADCDLDILIDLAGHTKGSRPAIYRHRPARVIVSHLAYHGCIGLAEVDYKITDQYADLPANAQFQVEKLLPLEGCLFPFIPVAPTAPGEFSKAKLGLQGKFLFATFVNLLKLSPRCLRTWKAILDAAPNALLAFSLIRATEQESIERTLQQAGIDKRKIIFLPTATKDVSDRSRYEEMDAVLDTFPYCGGDTTLAALDMNLPVVTLVGQRHAERIGLSLLSHLGCTDTIAYDEAQYIALGIRIATDAQWCQQQANKIKAAKKISPACDLSYYVKTLEAAYLKAIQPFARQIQSTMSAQEFHFAFNTALQFHQAGDATAAQIEYQKLLVEQPDFAPLNYFAGVLARDAGDMPEAIRLLRAALKQDPQFADAAAALGNIYLSTSDYAQATPQFAAALNSNPAHAVALGGMGLALTQQREFANALGFLRRAEEVQPSDAQAAFNYAVVLHQTYNVREAAEAYSRALSLKPDFADAALNFGLMLADQHQWQPAEELLRRTLAFDTSHELAYWRLREVLLATGQIDAWLANQAAYAGHHPQSVRQMFYQFETYRYRGELGSESRALTELIGIAIGMEHDHADAVVLLELLLGVIACYDVDPKAEVLMRERYQEIITSTSISLTETNPDLRARQSSPIRVGYLFDDVPDDARSRWLCPLVECHNSSQFEIFGYSLAARRSKIEPAFKQLALLAYANNQEAANIIAGDALDILVDLTTGQSTSRPFILAQKSAPIQIALPRGALPAALDACQWVITDAMIESSPPDSPQKIVNLKNGSIALLKSSLNPRHPYTRKLCGISPNAFVYAAFGELPSFSIRAMDLWRQILQAVPNAFIAISPSLPALIQSYKALLAAGGIAESRIVVIPRHPDAALNLGRFSLIDIALDSVPCNDIDMAQDAINMNVPIITLIGQRRAERQVYSLLGHLGITETLTTSGRDYVQLAIRLAQDIAGRQIIKSKMQAAIDNPDMPSLKTVVTELESHYIDAANNLWNPHD